MQYSTLIAQIEADIYSNGAELITGDILQTVLKRMVSAWASAGAAYGGTIAPDTVVPLNLDQATVYLALTAGTYEHFLDGNGDPIETTGPALVIYDGGPALIFTKTDLPSGGSGATVITVSPGTGNSLIITLPKAAEGIKGSYRIDMTAQYTGGSEVRYIGSLILEVNELVMQGAHGYYYGDDMAEILSEVAIWKDDPQIYPDEQEYYLLLTAESDLDEVIFSVSSLDGQSVDADAANEDEKVKVSDANITTVGGGGDGKIGIISQTQTWSGTGSNPRTYVMSNQVTGLIPQANIDLFESAGATFNESTGYFELNGLTDISYEEMLAIYKFTIGGVSLPVTNRTNFLYQARCRTNIPVTPITGLDKSITRLVSRCDLEVFAYNNLFAYELCTQTTVEIAANSYKLRKIIGAAIRLGNNTGVNNNFNNAYSLEDVNVTNLAANISIAQSPNFSLASIVYMVQNAANTSAITITIHATAYARCQADTTEYTWQGNTYTGIIALATAKNITIASA